MGEKIKDIGDFKIGGARVTIELNDGYSLSYSKYDIHIQNEKIQYCLSEREFMKLAAIIITAKKGFDKLKGNDQ